MAQGGTKAAAFSEDTGAPSIPWLWGEKHLQFVHQEEEREGYKKEGKQIPFFRLL